MLFESLEERVLFDAVPDGSLELNQDALAESDQTNADRFDASAAAEDVKVVADTRLSNQQSDTDGESVAEVTRELVIVDTSVEDYQQLIDDLIGDQRTDRVIDVVTIQGDDDGVAQITDILAGYDGLDALHIVSHGDDSGVNLGNLWLTQDNLAGYAGEIAQWGNALHTDGDLLFLGCDLASSADGRQLLQTISTLTGADVAASIDDTGAAARGGDWDLEFIIGSMETTIAFSSELQADWQHLLAPGPQVALNVPSTAFLGDTVNFTATFDNVGPVGDVGYGPFIDLIFPVNGADGAAGTSTADGLDFLSARYLGSAVTALEFVFPDDGGGTGTIEHPFAVDNTGSPLQVTGVAGDKLVVLQLPFGSVVPGQPTITIDIQAQLSDLADPYDSGSPETELDIRARAGFRYGADPADNPGSDPSIVSDTQVDSSSWAVNSTIQPQLLDMEKVYSGPEDETVTGPNFIRSYTINAFLADGQTITDLTFTDFLPNTFEYAGNLVVRNGGATISEGVGGYQIVSEPTTPGAQNPTSNELVIRLDQAATGAGPNTPAASITFDYFVPLNDANGDPVIDAASGDDVQVFNDASVTGDWLPIDVRDQPAISVTSNVTTQDHALDQKSIAIQKNVSLANDIGSAGVTPGDELEYTLDFQISDFFAFNDFIITDTFSDGQDWYGDSPTDSIEVMVPTLEFTEHGVTIASLAFSSSNYTVTENTDGTTTVMFNVSQELIDRAAGDPTAGELLGGWISQGGTGTGQPDGSFDAGATTGQIVYRTEILEDYKDPTGVDGSVDQGDSLDNSVVVDAALLNVDDLSVRGTRESDGSSAGISIATGNLVKNIYAINGDTNWAPFFDVDGDGNPNVVSGDLITYRIEYTLPTSDVEQFELEDFLPLPIFDSSGLATTRGATSDTPPGENQWHLHTSDTFTTFFEANATPADSFGGTTTVELVSDSATNSFRVQYGTVDDPASSSRKIDLLITVPVTFAPTADGLFFTNQVQTTERNTFGGETVNQVISQQDVQVNTPDLNIRKGIVDSSDTAAFTGTDGGNTVTFNETSTTAGFSGTINSDWLTSVSIDTLIEDLDAGDTARFAVVIENTGTSRTGAYDVTLSDLLPSGLTYVGGSLQVFDGTGAVLTYTLPDGSAATDADLFTTGLTISDPGATAAGTHRTDEGGLDEFDAADGRNIAVFVYDVTIDSTVTPEVQLDNTASLDNYASNEGGDSYVDTPETAQAGLTVRNVSATKTIAGTSEAHTGFVDGFERVAIGEIVRYRIEVEIPEGTLPHLTLRDRLPGGLTFIDDGTATIALVSDSGMTSSTLSGGSLNIVGNDGTVSGITPTFVLPDSAISENNDPGVENDTWATGDDPHFKLGNIVNNDSDANTEYVVIEFNALVDNNSTTAQNDTNDQRHNDLEILIDVDGNGTIETTEEIYDLPDASRPVVRVVEPLIQNLNKDVDFATGDAGDVVTYTVTFDAASGNSRADAFDVRLQDLLPVGELTLSGGSLSVSIDGTPQTAGVDYTDNSAGNLIDFSIGRVAQGESVTVTYQATIDSSVNPTDVVTNRANVTWTSLPGDFGTPDGSGGNATGSDLASVDDADTGGNSDPEYNTKTGEAQGQRDGSGQNDPETSADDTEPNDYHATSATSVTIDGTSLSKVLDGTSIDDTIGDGNNLANEAVIGEIVTYTVTLDFNEATLPNATLIDTLDTGLAFVGVTNTTVTGVTLNGSVDLTDPVVSNNGRTVTWDLETIRDTAAGNGNGAGDSDGQITITYQAVVTNVIANQSPSTQLNNSVNFQWDDDGATAPNPRESLTANAANVTVIEPTLTVTKTVALDTDADTLYDDGKVGDAGDAIQYTITLANTSGVDAFDIGFSDPLPTVSGGSSAILTPSFTVTDTATTGAVTAADFELVGSDAAGWTLQLRASSNIDMLASQDDSGGADRVITFTIQGTIASSVTPNQSVANTASAQWSSLNGGSTNPSSHTTDDTERTGADGEGVANLNNYATSDSDAFTINAPVFNKFLFATDQTETSGTNVTIGETVTYALLVSLPEGTTPDATVIDQLPPGLNYDNFQIIMTAAGSVDYLGNPLLQADFAGSIDAGDPSVSGGATDGADVTFTFGQIDVTVDNDSNNNAFLILVDAVVSDVSSNTGYVGNQQTLTNNATIDFATDAEPPQSAGAVDVTVVEPSLAISKEFGPTVNVDQADAGDTVTIVLTVDNNEGTSAAYDVVVQDILSSAHYDLSSVDLGVSGVDYPSDFTANFNSGSGLLQYSGGTLAAGTSVTFTITLDLADTVTPGSTLTNTATIENGSTLDGAEGGERDTPDADGDGSDSDSDTIRIYRNSLAGNVWDDTNNDGVFDGSEVGIGNVDIRLTGTDHLGNSVDTTIQTQADGSYLFDFLRPGTYTIEQDPTGTTVPSTFLDGRDTIGTPGGTDTVNDEFSGISLTTGTETHGTENNFGEIQPASITGAVYHDADNDGNFDGSETGIVGVSVRLQGTDDLGNTVDITVPTGAGGVYSFTNLRPSDASGYTVTQITEPAGYLDGRDTDGSLANGDTSVNNVISSIDVTPGDTGTGYNFGELLPSTLSGYVYHDSDNDGVRSDEPSTNGIPASQIRLQGTDDLGNSVDITVSTDADGYYEFTNLRPSNAAGYTITQLNAPAAYIDGRDTIGTQGGNDATNDVYSSIVVTSGTNGTENNFGELLPASLSGTVFNDHDNDGAYEPGDGETPIQGVQVRLQGIDDLGNSVDVSVTTDANGNYTFDNLRPSDAAGYRLTETQPANYNDGIDSDGSLANGSTVSNDLISSIDVVSGDNGVDYNFGERGTTISGTVFVDDNRDGNLAAGETARVPGVTIQLFDMTDPLTPVLVDTFITGSDGNYSFDNLPSGPYRIVETQPTQYGNTSPNTLDLTLPLTGSTGNNFGEALYDIGDTIYFDDNNNGVQDGTEQGIADVDVTLQFAGLDGIFGNGDDPAPITTTTDANGQYVFREQFNGDYTVTIDTTDLPTGLQGTAETDDAAFGPSTIDGVSNISVNDADRFDIDFGYAGDGSISDRVWHDVNGNGIQDAGEPGMVGVTVNLVHAGDDGLFGSVDDLTLTTTTGTNGTYLFDNLPAGDFRIDVDESTIPGSFSQTFVVDDAANTLPGVAEISLADAENRDDVDFGYTGTLSLGDRIWFDANNNGALDGGEPGLSGIGVTLVYAGPDGNIATTADNVTLTTTTDANGNYQFDRLFDGNYEVTVNTGDLPGGATQTFDQDDAALGAAALDHTSHIVLSGASRSDADFGYRGNSSIGDYIFWDVNNNGVADAGDRGLPGVRVTASVDLDGDTVVDYTTTVTTDIDGGYLFENLLPGTYTVSVEDSDLPAGMAANATADPDGVGTPHTADVVLAANEDIDTIDFGYTATSTIGDRVWLDTNGDGFQDATNEPGLANVNVVLTWYGADGVLDAGPGGDDEVFTTTTDADGRYLFEFLPGGNYSVDVDQSTAPSNTSLTTANDPLAITLPIDTDIDNADFGFVGGGSISDFVFYDFANDGLFNGDDVAYSGVEITITADVDGDGIDESFTTTTDANGLYIVDGLPYADYTVTLTAPAGTNASFDSDGTGTPNTSDVTLNITNQSSDTQDFGLTGTGSVGDTIFFDEDGDGIQDAGEVGIPGVLVTIEVDLDGDLAPDFTTTATTDQNGNYSFANIPAGQVTVTVATPSGTDPTTNIDGVPGADTSHSFALAAGETNQDQDFGFAGTGSIGDTVFYDVTGNGVMDGTDVGIPGVDVTLEIDFNGDGTVDHTLTVTTDSNGEYSFAELPAGDYNVVVTQPAGSIPTSDFDGTGTPNVSSLTLGAGEDNTLQDFGYTGNGALTDSVFFDINNNAGQDGSDRVLPGVDVTLTVDFDGDGNVDYTTTMPTDSNGEFLFTNLLAGTYTITTDRNDMPVGLANNPTVDNDGIATDHVAEYVLPGNVTVGGPGFGFHATPDYEITKTTPSASANAGDTIQYLIRVRNLGELDGRNVVITDTYPTDILTITNAGGGTVDAVAGTITWNLAAMNPGDEVIFNVTAVIADPLAAGVHDVTNMVSVTDDGFNGDDPDLTNNDSEATTSLLSAPDYTVTVTDNLAEADPGDQVTYEVVVANVGRQDGTGVVVTSQLKPELMLNVVPSAGGVYDPDTGIVTWNVGNLDSGDTIVFTIDATIPDPVPFGFDKTCNESVVTDDGTNGPDPTPENNVALDTTDLPVFAFDSFTDFSGLGKDLNAYNGIYHLGDDIYKQRHRPLPIDTVYTGIVDPGTTLSGKIYDQHGRLIGEQVVVADAAGNWLMQFPTVVLYETPHEMRIDQTLAVQNSTYDAGFNLRRFFHPAVHSQLYMNEPLSVGAALNHNAFNVLSAIHEANNDPLGFDWTHHSYQLIVSSTNTASN